MHKKSPWAKRVKKDRFKRKYLSKMQAQRLLQVDNEGLRRLLILKGIYPRSISKTSKQKDSGNSKQYYLAREIKWLVHDGIRAGVADFGAWEKQTRRAKAMQRFDTLKALQEAKAKPGYRLDVTLKERYPYFADALKDVDDAMSMIALYSFLTPEIKSETTVEFHHALPTGLHEKAKATLKEWMEFVSDAHLLTRSFVSIKGFYYEAYVGGERVVWLMPHEFAHAAADGVQQYILITFLEFYVELMRFVLFKLKHDRRRELADKERQAEDAADPLAEGAEAADFDAGAVIDSNAGVKKQQERSRAQLWGEEQKRIAGILNGLVFFVSREVPRKHVEMVIRAAGGSTVNEMSSLVTHCIVDRPQLAPGTRKLDSVEYVQPQYVFDCLNTRMLLPVQGYRMGEDLPPHVSPFTVSLSNSGFDNVMIEETRKAHPTILGYVPQRAHELRRLRDPTYNAADPTNKLGPKGDESDADSEVSETERALLAPDMGVIDDVALDDADRALLPKKAKWEDEQVRELAERTPVSALKVRKQREENLINRPTDDAVAQRRADTVAARVKKVQGESSEVRAKRKLTEQKREEATHRRMAVQLARKKAAKYYHMVSAAQKKVATKEKILETKAKTIQRGTAVVSGDGTTFQSSKASKKKEALQRGLKSEDASERRKAEVKQKQEKNRADPYRKLPKWVR